MYKLKFPYDDSVFSNLNEKSAYWVGFLLGDGYINENRIVISCSSKDEDILRQFRDFLKSPDRTIRRFITNRGDRASEVRIRSWKLVTDLRKYGMSINKRYRGRFHIDLLQPEIRRHVVRGYFDADGCFFHSRPGYLLSEITGEMPTMKDLKAILVKDGIINEQKNITKNGKVFRLRLSVRDTIKLGAYLYRGYPNIYCLSRKYALYKSHVERLNNLAAELCRSDSLKDMRPLSNWNDAKQAEWEDRKTFQASVEANQN